MATGDQSLIWALLRALARAPRRGLGRSALEGNRSSFRMPLARGTKIVTKCLRDIPFSAAQVSVGEHLPFRNPDGRRIETKGASRGKRDVEQPPANGVAKLGIRSLIHRNPRRKSEPKRPESGPKSPQKRSRKILFFWRWHPPDVVLASNPMCSAGSPSPDTATDRNFHGIARISGEISVFLPDGPIGQSPSALSLRVDF